MGDLRASSLVIQQYKNSPRLIALINNINDIITDELKDPANQLNANYSILTAEGIWLDRIGEKLGIARPSLPVTSVTTFGFDNNGVGFDQGVFTDDTAVDTIPVADDFFRTIIMARGAQLLTNGTVDSLSAALSAVFDGSNILDNQNMTIDVIIDGDLGNDEILLLTQTGLLTAPAGVRINDIQNVHEDGAFGFDSNGVGFDQAPFVKLINN